MVDKRRQSMMEMLESDEDVVDYILELEGKSNENGQMYNDTYNIACQAPQCLHTNLQEPLQVQMHSSFGDGDDIDPNANIDELPFTTAITSDGCEENMVPYMCYNPFALDVFETKGESSCRKLDFEAAFKEVESANEQTSIPGSSQTNDVTEIAGSSWSELHPSNLTPQPLQRLEQQNQYSQVQQTQQNMFQQQFDSVHRQHQPQIQHPYRFMSPWNNSYETYSIQQPTASCYATGGPSCQPPPQLFAPKQVLVNPNHASVIPTTNVTTVARFLPDVPEKTRKPLAKRPPILRRQKEFVKLKTLPIRYRGFKDSFKLLGRRWTRVSCVRIRNPTQISGCIKTSLANATSSRPVMTKPETSDSHSTIDKMIDLPLVGNSPLTTTGLNVKLAIPDEEKQKQFDQNATSPNALLSSSDKSTVNVRSTSSNEDSTPCCSYSVSSK